MYEHRELSHNVNGFVVKTSYVRVYMCVDMNADCLDEKAVITYIACLCGALHQHSVSAADAVHRQEVRNDHSERRWKLEIAVIVKKMWGMSKNRKQFPEVNGNNETKLHIKVGG